MAASLQWSCQSVVSFLLLAVLCAIGASILWVHQQGSRFIPNISSLTDTAQPSPDAVELIPGSLLTFPADFDASGRQELYDAETLYEKINGKAPLYLEADFKSLTTRRFMFGQDSSLWFEIFVYDMGTALNAFSVYSSQRRAGADVVPSLVSHEHYKTENGLFLRFGAYYIECIGSASSARLDAAMIAMGTELLTADPGKGAAIAGLQLFPDKDLVPGSFKLILKDVFGSEVLQNVYIAKYLLNGQEVTGFISPQDSLEQAKDVADGYFQFLVESEGVGDTVSDMQVVDLYGLVEVVFAAGKYVAGVHEGENRVDALEIAGRLRASLAAGNEKNQPQIGVD